MLSRSGTNKTPTGDGRFTPVRHESSADDTSKPIRAMLVPAIIIGAVIGFGVGLFSVAIGSHGGEAWPTMLFCGPVYPFASALGDNLGYVGGMVLGTALLYVFYGYCLASFRWWIPALAIATFHSLIVYVSLGLFPAT